MSGKWNRSRELQQKGEKIVDRPMESIRFEVQSSWAFLDDTVAGEQVVGESPNGAHVAGETTRSQPKGV